jgi:hypothetical protein
LSGHLYKQLASENKPISNKAEQLSAQLLSNFLMRGYSIEEIKRFQVVLDKLFSSEIDSKEFRNEISKPYAEGGVGLWKKKAVRIADYLEQIINKRKDVDGIYKSLEKNPEIPIFDEIRHIREWLIEGYTGELTPWQVMSLDQVISDRIHNIIKPEEVPDLFDLSKNKFGVGLSFRAAHLMAEKLELILNTGEKPGNGQEENSSTNSSIAEDIANASLKKL